MSSLITTNLKAVLQNELNNPELESLDVICSYVQNSGVEELEPFFAQLESQRVKVRIITTLQLGISHLDAIKRLKDHFSNIDIQVFCSVNMISFHAKAWLFKNTNDRYHAAIVGSSNISRSALLKGIEWSIRIQANDSDRMGQICKSFATTFDQYWSQQDDRFRGSLIQYSADTHARLEEIHELETLRIFGINDENPDPKLIEAAKVLRDAHTNFQQVYNNLERQKPAHMKRKRPLQSQDTRGNSERALRSPLGERDRTDPTAPRIPVGQMEGIEYQLQADIEKGIDQDNSNQELMMPPAWNGNETRVGEGSVSAIVENHTNRLFEAIRTRDINETKVLLKLGKIDANVRDYCGNTPLLIVLKYWNGNSSEAVTMTKALIYDGNADVNLPDSEGKAPLSLAIYSRDVALIRVLLEDGRADTRLPRIWSDLLAAWLSSGQDYLDSLSPLEESNCKDVVKLLLGVGKADIKLQDDDGNTPLLLAVEHGNYAVVELILDTGRADVEAHNSKGETAVKIALRAENDPILRLLIKKGKAKVRWNNNPFNVMAYAQGKYSLCIYETE
jgi:ankyrin repeat protein/HKD family nuclease